METIEDLVTLNEIIENLKCGAFSPRTITIAIEILERLGQIILDSDLPNTYEGNELESMCR